MEQGRDSYRIRTRFLRHPDRIPGLFGHLFNEFSTDYTVHTLTILPAADQ